MTNLIFNTTHRGSIKMSKRDGMRTMATKNARKRRKAAKLAKQLGLNSFSPAAQFLIKNKEKLETLETKTGLFFLNLK